MKQIATFWEGEGEGELEENRAGLTLGYVRRSTIMAMPWPPPTHMLSMP
jgi:hypothetical protein